MYYTVACTEMATEAVKGNNEDLRKEKDYLPFLTSLSHFVKELFFISEENSNGPCVKRHDVKEEYLSAICHHLASELSGFECFDGILREELQYVAALIKVVKYFSHGLNDVLSTNTQSISSDLTNILVMQKLSIWIVNSGFLSTEEISHLGMDVLSYCIIVEMRFFASVGMKLEMSESRQQQSIENAMKIFSQKLIAELLSISTWQEMCDEDLGVASSYVGDYNCGLQVMIYTVHKLNIGNYSSVATGHVERALLPFLDHEKVVQLVQCLFEIISKTTERKDFLLFTLRCIKLVQNYSLLLHCAFSIGIPALKTACNLFCEKTSLLFNAIASLPWVSLSRWEDFESDLKASGLKDAYLLKISKGLDNNRLHHSDDVMLESLSNSIVHECLKAISILHSPKYARFRSTILFKWSNGKSSEIKNTALTFLPFFIVKALPGTAAFKGILSHIRTLMKNVEADFCHSNLLSLSFLLHKITMLMICPCEIILTKPLDNLCKECEYFRPHINNFRLDFKRKSDESSLRKQKDDVLLMLGSVVMEVSNVMTGRWISFDCYHKSSADAPTTKICYKMLQNQVVEFSADYLTLIKDRPMSDNTRFMVKNWLQSLQYYDDTLLYTRIVSALNLKHESDQVKDNMKIMEDIVT